MSISNFYTKEFTIKRSSWLTDGDGNSYSEPVEVETFKGHMQQASAELVETLRMTLTKAFSVWCEPTTDVKEGDTLESDGKSYSVKAMQLNETGNNKHIQLTVELDEVEAPE